MYKRYHDFLIRDWVPTDREDAAAIIGDVLHEFGLGWEPNEADRDVLQVEECYYKAGGQFWVVEQNGTLVATAAFYPVPARKNRAEIRKMYLRPQVRGQGLGHFLLAELESYIRSLDFEAIQLETSTKLTAAIKLYERNGYQPMDEVETARCDRAYEKYLD